MGVFGKNGNKKICISLQEAVKINLKWKELRRELEYLREENLFLKKELAQKNLLIKDYEKDEPFFDKISKLEKKNKFLEKRVKFLEKRNFILEKINDYLFRVLDFLKKEKEYINTFDKKLFTKNRIQETEKREKEIDRLLKEFQSLKTENEKEIKEQKEPFDIKEFAIKKKIIFLILKCSIFYSKK